MMVFVCPKIGSKQRWDSILLCNAVTICWPTLCNTVLIWLEPPLCNTVIIWRDPRPPIRDYVICAQPHICFEAQYLLNHIWEIWRFAPDWSAIQLPGLESQKKSFIDSQSTAWLYFWSRLWGIKSSPFFGYLREFAVRRFIEEVPVVEKKCDRDALLTQCNAWLHFQCNDWAAPWS